MANGNRAVIKEMKEIIASGKTVDIDTRDRLLFTGIIDIYDELEKFRPVIVFYKIGMFFASALGAAVLALIWGMVTHQVAISFP